MKNQCKYIVKYKWDVTGSNSKSSFSNKSKAMKFVKELKRENKISAHNTSVIRGKAFKPFKNIKLVRNCK